MLGKFKANQIYRGECAQLMSDLPPACIDLTVTSPPYDNLRAYHGYTFDFESIANQLYQVTKTGGVVVWVVGDATINGSETGTSFRQALHFMELGFNLHDTMIYHRNSPPLTHNRYEQRFEYMFVFSKGVPQTFTPIKSNRRWKDNRKKKVVRRERDGSWDMGYSGQSEKVIIGNVWSVKVGGGHTTKDKFAYQHPAMFPEALARDHILSWSNPGDIVFDPMCGSGTTCKMAKETGRQFLGFEISEEYCEIARKRVQRANVPLFTL